MVNSFRVTKRGTIITIRDQMSEEPAVESLGEVKFKPLELKTTQKMGVFGALLGLIVIILTNPTIRSIVFKVLVSTLKPVVHEILLNSDVKGPIAVLVRQSLLNITQG